MSSAESIGLREFGYFLGYRYRRARDDVFSTHGESVAGIKNRVVAVMIKIESGSMLK